MLVPANRRNPVRVAAEGALALASAVQRGSRILSPIVDAANTVGSLIKGKKKNKRTTESGMVAGIAAAPTTFGYTLGAHKISLPKACSYNGQRGVCFSGTQTFCLVRSAAATTDPGLILKDGSVAGDVNGFYVIAYIRPALAANASDTTKHSGVIEGLDPLVTQMSVYRRYRFRKLAFVYIPKTGTNATSQIALAFSPSFVSDTTANSSPPVSSVPQLEQYECSVSFPAWQEAILDCSKSLCSDRLMTVNNGVPTINQFSSGTANQNELSPNDLSPGCLIAAIDGSVAGTTYGRLLVMYEIELYYRGPKVTVDSIGNGELPDFRAGRSDKKDFFEEKKLEKEEMSPVMVSKEIHYDIPDATNKSTSVSGVKRNNTTASHRVIQGELP